MAMLSTLWKNVWLQHGQLVFDQDFFQSIQNYVAENSTSAQSDVERWCSFLSRNGIEELTLHLFVLRSMFKLPICIFSCHTIKRLKLDSLIVDFPANAPCIFPGVTSLVFDSVELNGVASTIPNLEKLAFLGDCEGMDKFQIIAPKLESLCHISGYSGFEPTWFAVQLNRIKTLCLSGGSFLWRRDIVTAVLNSSTTAINLQVMELHDLSFSCELQISTAMTLLQKSPNLCELGIGAAMARAQYEEDTLNHLEDPDHYFINQDMKMLKTVKIDGFNGSRLEVLFIKSVFSKCPALERVVIHPAWSIIDALMGMNILRELACFPRASPNAQLVFLEHESTYNLVGYNVIDEY
ncbi:F-box/FBD/LRR-repeat protein At1g13570-like [Ipomoea triloba]|uniref:F-box/FBD/LRR-repeat protein At1g13570-like n=1 Tax=Ipomoea triloba TaxID=35885 RepID=UPI00125E7A06|nr:F-box/FBD/LRR-repeat protein At1g13570-like [Ipomoea triloba]